MWPYLPIAIVIVLLYVVFIASCIMNAQPEKIEMDESEGMEVTSDGELIITKTAHFKIVV